MNSKYAHIETTDELDAAIRSAHRDRQRKQKLLKRDIHGVREYYKPVKLAMNLVQRSPIGLSWTQIGLGLIRGLRKKLK